MLLHIVVHITQYKFSWTLKKQNLFLVRILDFSQRNGFFPPCSRLRSLGCACYPSGRCTSYSRVSTGMFVTINDPKLPFVLQILSFESNSCVDGLQLKNEGIQVATTGLLSTSLNSITRRKLKLWWNWRMFWFLNLDCGGACAIRCSKSSRPNLCKRACGTCCARCRCVPAGTHGNEDSCPCYATMTTHGGARKCPWN